MAVLLLPCSGTACRLTLSQAEAHHLSWALQGLGCITGRLRPPPESQHCSVLAAV